MPKRMKKSPSTPAVFVASLKRYERIYGDPKAVRDAVGGVPQSLYNKWRLGKALPSVGMRLSICQLLECKDPGLKLVA